MVLRRALRAGPRGPPSWAFSDVFLGCLFAAIPSYRFRVAGSEFRVRVSPAPAYQGSPPPRTRNPELGTRNLRVQGLARRPAHATLHTHGDPTNGWPSARRPPRGPGGRAPGGPAVHGHRLGAPALPGPPGDRSVPRNRQPAPGRRGRPRGPGPPPLPAGGPPPARARAPAVTVRAALGLQAGDPLTVHVHP